MEVLSVKRLLGDCYPMQTKCCPSMDLIAVVSQNDTVDVWRINGQRVFGYSPEEGEGSKIWDISWRFNGRALAILLNTGTTIIIDSFTGKIVHQLSAGTNLAVPLPDWSSPTTKPSEGKSARSPFTRLKWTVHQLNSTSSKADVQFQDIEVGARTASDSVDPCFDRTDLPHTLANIDIELSLPKLSTLPPMGTDDDVFSTRTAIDSIFHSSLTASESPRSPHSYVEVLLANIAPQQWLVRIFDSFEIGIVDLATALPKGYHPIAISAHASHPNSPEHFFVIETMPEKPGPDSRDKASPSSLHLVRLQLKFLQQKTQHLPLLVAKATQLQNLLRYMQHVQKQLSAEVRTAFDLPRRFLNNIDEALQEQDANASFKTACYHLISTGECNDQFKEWLIDELGERGIKRWEKAVGDCLDMLRRMTSECLLPVIERCQVVLSRLEGMSRYDETSLHLGLHEKDIRPARETLDALTIICEDMLQDVCVEIREFATFMKWFKWEAEVESLGEDSERAEEMRESFSAEAELRTVLHYVDVPVRQSRVLNYISADTKPGEDAEADAAVPDSHFYETFKSGRKRRRGAESTAKLGALILRLQSKTDTLCRHISETLRKSMIVQYLGEVPKLEGGFECRIVANNDKPASLHLLSKDSGETGGMVQTVIPLTKSMSSPLKSSIRRGITSPEITKIHDFKFLGDSGFVMLATCGNDRHIIGQPLQPTETARQSKTLHTFAKSQMAGGMAPGFLNIPERGNDKVIVAADEQGMGYVVLKYGPER